MTQVSRHYLNTRSAAILLALSNATAALRAQGLQRINVSRIFVIDVNHPDCQFKRQNVGPNKLHQQHNDNSSILCHWRLRSAQLLVKHLCISSSSWMYLCQLCAGHSHGPQKSWSSSSSLSSSPQAVHDWKPCTSKSYAHFSRAEKG